MKIEEIGSLKARAARAALAGDLRPLDEWRSQVAELVGAPVPPQVRWANLPGLQAQYLAEEGDSPLLSDTIDEREEREERVWMVPMVRELMGTPVVPMSNNVHIWLTMILFQRSTWELIENVPADEPGWRRLQAIPLP